jgi:hypothetical protein
MRMKSVWTLLTRPLKHCLPLLARNPIDRVDIKTNKSYL